MTTDNSVTHSLLVVWLSPESVSPTGSVTRSCLQHLACPR